MTAAAILVVLLAGCSGDVHQAEVLSTPFPGTILQARATGEKCHADGCSFDYRVRITNPTDRDANVQECMLATPHLRLPVMGTAGVGIPAHATGTVEARFVLPVKKNTASDWVGQRITCTGLDWHGHPPI